MTGTAESIHLELRVDNIDSDCSKSCECRGSDPSWSQVDSKSDRDCLHQSLQVASCLELRAREHTLGYPQSIKQTKQGHISHHFNKHIKSPSSSIYLVHLVKFNRLRSLPTFPDDGRAVQLLQSRIRTAKPNLAKLLGNILAVWALLLCHLFFQLWGSILITHPTQW